MKAYVYGANGAEITDVAKPAPKGTQVLVRVHACGLNRADLGMTKGHAHGSAGGVGTVLGMEWAGEVAELGPDAKGVKVGDRIMGSGGAAFAEYTLADHGRLFRAPSQHELRRSRHPARRARHHAQRGRDQRRAAGGPDRPDPGRELRRRPDGDADRKAQGRQARDRLVDRCDAPRPAEGIRRRPRGRFQRSRLGRSGAAGDRRRRRRPDRRSGLGQGREPESRRRPRSRAASSMSAGSAAPTPISISTCMPRAASTISASPSAPARSRKSARSSTRSARISGRRWNRASCNCRSTRCFAFDDIGKAFEHMEANKHLGKIVVTL